MCAPVSVATGGSVSSCMGICAVMPQIFAYLGIFGVVVWNFRNALFVRLRSLRHTAT